MRFTLRPLGQADAEEIAAWTIPASTASTTRRPTPTTWRPLPLAARSAAATAEPPPPHFYAAGGDDGRLAGYFQLKLGPDRVELRLGVGPTCAARVGPGVDAGRDRPDPEGARRPADHPRRGSVNVRAITVYERCGFAVTGRHIRHTAGREWEFVDMESAARA